MNQQQREALDYSMGKGAVARHVEAIAALRQLLEQPVQEPVAFLHWYDNAHWGNEDFKEGCHRAWNAAIEYTTPPAQPAVPEGWKLVPVEPTEIMQDAGVVVMPTVDCHPYDAGMVYKAMIAAAPKQGE
jgi:hypothetical protein